MEDTAGKPGQNVRMAAIGLLFAGAFFLGLERPRVGLPLMIASAPVTVVGLMMDRTLPIWMRLMFSFGALIGLGLLYLYIASD